MLDPEELEEIRRLEASGATRPAALAGEMFVSTGPLGPILTFAGLVAAAVVAGLGSWPGALAIVGVIAGAWVLRPRRVRRFRIDGDRMFLSGAAAPVAWENVREITFAIHAPLAVTERDRVHSSVAHLAILEGLQRHVLAQGQLFGRAPRAPVRLDVLSRFLRGHAERSGMRVVVGSATEWTATR